MPALCGPLEIDKDYVSPKGVLPAQFSKPYRLTDHVLSIAVVE
jgi:hypothetical protein